MKNLLKAVALTTLFFALFFGCLIGGGLGAEWLAAYFGVTVRLVLNLFMAGLLFLACTIALWFQLEDK